MTAPRSGAELLPITGSYRAEDCCFLLTPLDAEYTEVAVKEANIQSGQRHYSEMISREAAPSDRYMALFHTLTERYKRRLAKEILSLAAHLAARRQGPVTVVSLARAGTPVGALLTRALIQHLNVPAVHYSISIIRDRGIDTNALHWMLRTQGRTADSIVFVDAWTAKGVITQELKKAVAEWNTRNPEQLQDKLYVVSDIGGTADVAATYDDYAIPSGILNAPVSGLISRSILNHKIGVEAFHGCVILNEMAGVDRSNWFLDEVSAEFPHVEPACLTPEERQTRQGATAACIERWMADYNIRDINHIKPGIAEATRVMLRRVPERLLLKDAHDADVAHLQLLAEEKQIPISFDAEMPFKAVSFIKDVF